MSLPALVRLCNILNEILLNSVLSVAGPGLLREVAAVFSDTSADEMYLMLTQAKSVKAAVRVKKLLADT